MTTKTLIYKVCRFNKEENGKQIQALLTKALKSRKAAVARRMQTDSSNQYMLINHSSTHNGMLVGEFFDYTQGHKQPLTRLDHSVDEFEISALAPPDKQSEFLHSILYFGVWRNSVFLSQALSLRSAQLEIYLNWLLSECKLLEEGDFVSLVDHPPAEARKKIVNTRGIEFHAPVTLGSNQKANERADAKAVTFKPQGLGWEALKKILPAEMSLPNTLGMKDIVLGSSLEVTLTLSWSRLGKSDPTSLLDTISNQLRHVDTELDYTIRTRSGTITRDQIKLRKPISVGTTNEGLIRRSEIWAHMHEWLQVLLQEERIVSDA
jgi:hypothetical protein